MAAGKTSNTENKLMLYKFKVFLWVWVLQELQELQVQVIFDGAELEYMCSLNLYSNMSSIKGKLLPRLEVLDFKMAK